MSVSVILRQTLGRKLTYTEMDSNWTNIQAFFKPINVTYAELTAAIAGSLLEPGHFYLLTDYATSHYIQYTDVTGDGTGGGETVNTGAVEPLVLLANSTNTLALEAISPLNPQDIILYQPTMVDRNYDYCAASGKGCIVRRFDTMLEYSRDYDFRAVIFRRWETVTGNGLFRSFTPVPGAAHQDTLAQNGTTGIFATNIYSLLGLAAPIGLPYWLDNIVIQPTCSGMVINEIKGAACTFYTSHGISQCQILLAVKVDFGDGNISSNKFSTIINCTFSGDVQQNNVGSMQGCVVANFKLNTSSKITNCTPNNGAGVYYDITGNDVDVMENCTNAGPITGNVCDNVYQNSNAGGIVGCVVTTIDNNTNAGEIQNVTVNDCSNNSGNGNIQNVVGNQFSNNVLTGDIIDCMGVDIYGCNIATPIKGHQFLGAINGKTITGTGDMQNAVLPTVSRYDKGDSQHHEEIVTGGVISFSAAVTA